MTTTSPRNTVLTEPDGTAVYKVSTPRKLGNRITTITRGDDSEVVAVIHWNLITKNTITMDGKTQTFDEVFPKPKKLSRSRVYTTAGGEKFRWKNTIKLYCISESTGLSLATYYRVALGGIRSTKSTLDISPDAIHLKDILVVTWSIMETEGED
ncbi:hypothetical protein CTheo_5085 [Ceratobasidium theobromae]|uniref:DUF6593 domain-containing protein n=1 Tax=Ceratobasidium theobromae TaxID=1582974 RepID=A0A5N5QJ38_9AGAM|nr:hypothetical protein CTheo_5085 [Ceratobasidium theobromae]